MARNWKQVLVGHFPSGVIESKQLANLKKGLDKKLNLTYIIQDRVKRNKREITGVISDADPQQFGATVLFIDRFWLEAAAIASQRPDDSHRAALYNTTRASLEKEGFVVPIFLGDTPVPAAQEWPAGLERLASLPYFRYGNDYGEVIGSINASLGMLDPVDGFLNRLSKRKCIPWSLKTELNESVNFLQGQAKSYVLGKIESRNQRILREIIDAIKKGRMDHSGTYEPGGAPIRWLRTALDALDSVQNFINIVHRQLSTAKCADKKTVDKVEEALDSASEKLREAQNHIYQNPDFDPNVPRPTSDVPKRTFEPDYQREPSSPNRGRKTQREPKKGGSGGCLRLIILIALLGGAVYFFAPQIDGLDLDGNSGSGPSQPGITPRPTTPVPAVFAAFTSETVDESTIAFNNLSGNAIRYQWDFDDGSPIVGETNPIHEFRCPDTQIDSASIFTFDVRLTAYGAAGDSDTFEDDVTVRLICID